MQIINTAERTLTLQQRRHDELTNALAKVARQRDEAIDRLCRLNVKLTDLKRKVGRSGKRLADTREALQEVADTPPPTPVKPPRAKAVKVAKLLPSEGDPLAEVLSTPAIDKAAKLRDELRGERMRKRN